MKTAIESHPNLIVLQTFSKAWGMAGLRIGMAISDPRIAELYARVKYPYNINGPTQREIINRIRRTDIDGMVRSIIDDRDMLMRELPKCPCVKKIYPSDANFLLAEVTDANAVYDYLILNGVIVRNRSRLPGCAGCLRLTIGTPEENRRMLNLLQTYSISE